MEYRIIDAEERHIDDIEEIERLCFSLPWTKEQLRGQLRNGQHEFLAAVDKEERPLGYVGMMYVLDEGYISNVAVAGEYRRLGIGDALIETLEERAEALSLAFLTLEVRAGNTAAIRLYEKHGFAQVGRRKNYYELPREDALLMTKFLKRGTKDENSGV